MQPALILTELGRVLPAADVPQVLAAIKEDDLVWSTLQNPGIVRSILSDESAEISFWSPASLALRPLSERINIVNLCADHIPAVEGSLKKQAVDLLEAAIKSGAAVKSLTDAGLVALALRERRRKMQSWRGINEALSSVKLKPGQSLFEVWKTPLACLFGMIPDREELLKALITKESLHPAIEWETHILLCNPLDPETRLEMFYMVLQASSRGQQIEWLRYLKRKGQTTLASALATRILGEQGPGLDVTRDDFNPDQSDWSEIAQFALSNQFSAFLHQLAGHPLQANLHLEKVRTTLQHWLFGSTIQGITIPDPRADQNPEKEQCAQMLKQYRLSEKSIDAAMFALGNDGQEFSLSDSIGARTPMLVKVEQAKQLAACGSLRQAQEIAYVAVQDWLRQVTEDPENLSGQFVFEYSPWALLNPLVTLGLYSDAISVGEKFLTVRPEDLELMLWLSDMCHRMGEDEKSINLISQLILFDPNNAETQRKMAGYYEDRQDWDEGMAVRRRILEIVPMPAIDDQLALARCAIGGKYYAEVTSACEKILNIDPDQGLAYTYKGMARMANGEVENGLADLNKATLLIPEIPLPWIQLSEAYKQNGDAQRALETLRAAIITAPESAELHFALGTTCLEAGLTTEALPFLRQSARLDPESDRVGLALAETLLHLGHEPEALEVIEKAREHWPAHAELANLHAKILLGKGETDCGLSILEIALQSDNPRPEWFILYSKTLIGEYEQISDLKNSELDALALIKANKMIQKAVQIAPESFEARLLLAEVLSLRGEHEAAYAAYLQIVELPEANLPEWNWRVQAGLGRTALALQQTETALASLQNAILANPESISLQRTLSQAYRQANLIESAQGSAKAALALAPDNIDNLMWFGGFMNSVDGADEAVQAYNLARQIAPERIDLGILMAETLLKKGDLEECRQVLQKTTEMDKIKPAELRQIAKTYLRTGDHTQALTCLERAISAQGEDSADLLFEMADLYARIPLADKALEQIQKAIRINPRKIEYYIFQSDVQDQANRPQAALASLEHALRLIGARQTELDFTEKSVPSAEQTGGVEQSEAPYDIVDIHLRFARLLQKVENLGSALYHAEKALEERPENVETRCLAVELAMKQLQFDRAEKLAVLPDGSKDSEKAIRYSIGDESYWLGGLSSLLAELALERSDYVRAEKLVSNGLVHAPAHPRLKAAEIRLLAHDGDYQKANNRFADLFETCAPTIYPDQRANARKEDNTQVDSPTSLLCSVAAAALDLHRWKEGLDILEKYTSAYPTEPKGLMTSARAMVRAAEWRATSAGLLLCSHRPAESSLDERAYAKFIQMIAEAGKYSTSSEIECWKARGEAAFHPSAGAIRTLAGLQTNAEDVSALVLAMSRLGNTENARQVGEPYANDAKVNLQLSLLAEEQTGYSVEKARAAAALDPKNPIYHAAAARALEAAGEPASALESLENALFYWPDEGSWQGWAGKLASLCADPGGAVEHYEKAYQLLPESIEVATGLGKSYLRTGKAVEAVSIFTKASKTAPGNAETWLNLADAQLASGSAREAMASAETSARLDPKSAAARVACAEISFELGGEAKALDMVRAALKIDPANIRARLLTSKILISKGKEKEALTEISKGVDELPQAVDLQIEKARLVYKLQGAKEALRLILPLVDAFQNNEQLLALQARAYADVGEMDRAESTALQSVRLNPSQPLLHKLLGNIYQQKGQLDKSVYHLSEAARLDANNADIYLELGEVYTERREFSQALEAYQQAMRADPEDHRPFYQSALVLRDGKDYQAAETMLRRAAQLAPNDVNIRRQLGAIVALNLVQSCQEASTCQ